ncbi:MAG: hypothetical protein KAX28_12505 [Candidatus Marinimicrobia bacterium]|nr:hypothetical protein [Candidatus Neomarinimicrobiota bacterium]
MARTLYSKKLIPLFLLISLFSFFFSASLSAQEYMQWRMSGCPLFCEGQPYATEAHMLGSAYIADLLDYKMTWWQSDALIFGLGLTWEIKDALVPYEKAGAIGGEGFALNDVLANVIGITTHRLSILLWNRFVHGKWTLNGYNYVLKKQPTRIVHK